MSALEFVRSDRELAIEAGPDGYTITMTSSNGSAVSPTLSDAYHCIQCGEFRSY